MLSGRPVGVSVDKCCVVSLCKGDVIDQSCIGDAQLRVVTSCRELGVISSNDFSPSPHINDNVFRAH